jgi:hypothetical protein
MVKAYINDLDVSSKLIDQSGSLHILREMQDELTYEPVVSSATFSISDLDGSVAEYLNLPSLSNPTRIPKPAVAKVFDKHGDPIFTGDIDTDGAERAIFDADNPDDSRRLHLTGYDKLKALSLKWKHIETNAPSDLLRLAGKPILGGPTVVNDLSRFDAEVRSHLGDPTYTMQELFDLWMQGCTDKITVVSNNDGNQIFVPQNFNCTVGQLMTTKILKTPDNPEGKLQTGASLVNRMPSVYDALRFTLGASLATIIAVPTGEMYYIERFAQPKDIVPPIRISKYSSSRLLGGTKKNYLSFSGIEVQIPTPGNGLSLIQDGFSLFHAKEIYYLLSDDESSVLADLASNVDEVRDEYSVIRMDNTLVDALPFTFACARRLSLANGTVIPEFSIGSTEYFWFPGIFSSNIISRMVKEALLSSRSFEVSTQADKFFATQRVIVEDKYYRILSADIDPFADVATLKIYPTGQYA